MTSPGQNGRVLVFVAAAAALVAVALALSLAGDTPEATPDRQQAEGRAIESATATAVTTGMSTSSDATAKGFVRAYLKYEVGRLDKHSRRAIRRLSSKSLAAELLGTPVRLPPGSKAPREQFLQLVSTTPTVGGDGYVEVAAHVDIRRDGRRDHLAVRLALLGSQWVVMGVGP